mmetsp:Transcript_35623/g.102443  ORF Transcript_35623/g.102443 Transcript_35623/m.102443 type:complete len:309 (-) Transcript_35623:1536-2462(-)
MLQGSGDGSTRPVIERGHVGGKQAALPSGLRLLKLRRRAEVEVRAARPLRTLPHVRVRVPAPAVGAAPRAEPAGAAGARQGEAPVKVHERLPAARALAGQDLLLDVEPCLEDRPLLLLEHGHAVQLGCQPLLHLALQLFDLALLEQGDARLDVSAEGGRGNVSSHIGVGKVAAVALGRMLRAEDMPLAAAVHTDRCLRKGLNVLVEAVAAHEMAALACALQALRQPAVRTAKVTTLAGHHAAPAGLVLAPRRDAVKEWVLQQLRGCWTPCWISRLELLHQHLPLGTQLRDKPHHFAKGKDVARWRSAR